MEAKEFKSCSYKSNIAAIQAVEVVAVSTIAIQCARGKGSGKLTNWCLKLPSKNDFHWESSDVQTYLKKEAYPHVPTYLLLQCFFNIS